MSADEKRQQIARRARKRPKIGRDAFLYFEGGDDFAQCSSCASRNADTGVCSTLGVKVEPGSSCGVYVPGKYDGSQPAKRMTSQEAGLVKRQVRCENCRYGGADDCALYQHLNKELPGDFDLDTKIKPHGCCNANMA